MAAQQLNRQWIGIDIEKQAAEILVERLSSDAGMFKDFIHTEIIPERTDIKKEPISLSIKERLYGEQKGICNACDFKNEIWHFEIDHIISKSKGGTDTYSNYQLLCGNCNRTKGDRPMDYLRYKIKKRRKLMETQVSFGR